MLTSFILHMFVWVWYMHQNVHAYMHMLRHQNIVTFTHKKHMYMHGCVYPCIYYIVICICEDMDMLKHT